MKKAVKASKNNYWFLKLPILHSFCTILFQFFSSSLVLTYCYFFFSSSFKLLVLFIVQKIIIHFIEADVFVVVVAFRCSCLILLSYYWFILISVIFFNSSSIEDTFVHVTSATNLGDNRMFMQRTLSYFVRGSITVRLTSCLTGLDSAALLMFNQQKIYLFGQIQTSRAR